MKKLFLVLFLLPVTLFAETGAKFEVAAWLPYWKFSDAKTATLPYLAKITELSPFSYTVKADGTLKDPMDIASPDWQNYLNQAKQKGVSIYPSILWTDRAAMETLLNDKKKRTAHIAAIKKVVTDNNFDGIDIDYEGKSAETRVGFANFLSELKKSLGTKKKLVCTIEARTPIDSRYSKVTKELIAKIEYSNDFKAIGKSCDVVRIMAYDQSTDDVQLNTKYANTLYKPIADIDWVKKVVTLALEDIPAKKIELGVATYGYKYEFTGTTGSTTISRVGAMNYIYADELAKSLSITPIRNQAGELSFTYNANNLHYLVWYSDAEAIADKIRIAKLYKLRGISIFKLDGGYDPRLINILP